MIMRTVAHRYFNQKHLRANFFLRRDDGDFGHAEQNDIINQSHRDQRRQLVLNPLSRLDNSSSPSSCVLTVDSVDECDSDDDIRMTWQLLTEA